MNPFSYIAPQTVAQALTDRAHHPHAAYLAGGTNLIDEMKLGVEKPDRLIDVSKVGYDKIASTPSGGLLIGANVRNSALAYDARVQKQYPVLSEALLSGASPQLRNVATTAGNLLQRTRCMYFRDGISPCNKRVPGSGCSALDGFNRIHAILGTSDRCIATHPSDMDVALVALEAVVHVIGERGQRSIAIDQFYVPYGEDPSRENTLQAGEFITGVELPATAWFAKSEYLKARDRASYEFALSSAAVALDVRDGTIQDARIALGGVATKPWRAVLAEQALRGQRPGEELFRKAADAELAPAKPRKFNAFKIELCRRVMIQTLKNVAAKA